MKTVKELREYLEQFLDDMPIYTRRHNMETGSTIENVYEPQPKILYPSSTFGVDAFDGTPYTKKTFSTIAFDEELKKAGFEALVFY